MAVNPILVNAGSMNNMGNQNSAFGLMGKALNDMESRRNTRNTNARAASDRLLKNAESDATRDIIGATKKNTVMDDFQNRFDTEYASIYDDSNQVADKNGVMGPAIRKGMEAKAAKWSDGGFGASMDQTEQDNLMRLEGGVDDAGRYSQDIYDRMLKAGLSPAQAEAQRKTQMAKWKKPEMSKQALQNQKILSDAANKRYETTMDLAKAMGKTSQSGGQSGGTNGSSRSGSSKTGSKGKSWNDQSIAENLQKSLGFEDDTFVGTDAGDAVGTYRELADAGFNQNEALIIMDKVLKSAYNIGDKTYMGDYDADVRQYVKDNELTPTYSGSGSKGGKSGFSQSAFSGYTPAAQKRIMETESKASKILQNELSTIMNSGNQPGKEAVLDSIFNWHSEPAKKKAVVDVNKNTDKKNAKILKDAKVKVKNRDFKKLTPQETILLDKDNRDNPTKISPEGTIDLGVDPSKVEIPNDKFLDKEPEAKVLSDGSGVTPKEEGFLPSWMTSVSPAGGKGQVPGGSGYRSSNSPKQNILPSIDSGSTNQRVTDARNKNAVLEFNRAQDARIQANSPEARKQKVVSSIVSDTKMSFSEKLSKLRDQGISTAEAQQLLSRKQIL